MAKTYEPIATTTLGSAAASYTFSSISGSYTDLFLIASAKNNTSASDIYMQFNADTATNYSYTYLTGTGSVAASGRGSSQTAIICDWSAAVTSAASTFSLYQINVQNYSNATTYKTALIRGNSAAAASAGTDAIVGLWRSTSAITSIKIYPGTGSFDTGSTFTLYGIKAFQPMPRGNFSKYAHCTIDDCTKDHRAKGMCQMHYRRNRLYNDPTVIMNVGIKQDKGGYVQVRTVAGNGKEDSIANCSARADKAAISSVFK